MAKKKVNQELNLTSYIDLMSTLIIFLLMTAAWNQMEALSTNTANVTASDSSEPPPNETKKVSLTVTVFPDRIELSEDQKLRSFPNVGGQIDTSQIISVLMDWKTRFPDRTDITLNTDNQIPYKSMIEVFDILVGNKFPDVGLNTL